MKKSKIKALKQLSQLLPESVTINIEPMILKGWQLSEEELLNMKNVEAESWYKKKQYKIVPVNHLTKLKRAYCSNKEQGLADYIEWVDVNNKRMNKIFSEMKLKEVDDELKEIARKGGEGFWSNIMAFLFSFFKVFLKK